MGIRRDITKVDQLCSGHITMCGISLQNPGPTGDRSEGHASTKNLEITGHLLIWSKVRGI